MENVKQVSNYNTSKKKIESKKYILIFVIILLLIALGIGGFFLFKFFFPKKGPTGPIGPSGTDAPTGSTGTDSPTGPTGTILNCKNGGVLVNTKDGNICQCPDEYDGNLCQCKKSDLQNNVDVTTWYCKGKYPVCNDNGTYSQSDNNASTCGELSNIYDKYNKYIDYKSLNCCPDETNCPNCKSECTSGQYGIMNMFSCGNCAEKNNLIDSMICKNCKNNQYCTCDVISGYSWQCRDYYPNSECEIATDQQCKDKNGNVTKMQCKECGKDGQYVLICPGNTNNEAFKKCVNESVTYIQCTIWDPITNLDTKETVKVAFDNRTNPPLPVYPTFLNCSANCQDSKSSSNTSFLVWTEAGIDMWSYYGNKPGIYFKKDGNDYFVSYDLSNPEMNSTFFNEFTCTSSNKKCKKYDRNMIVNEANNIYPICWTDKNPICQDGGKKNQLVQFFDENLNPGDIEPLYECNTNGGIFNCQLNPKINLNYISNETNVCLGKGKSLLTTKDNKCNPVQLLIDRACTYSDIDTVLNDVGQESPDYYLDYNNDNDNDLSITNC
jgi:hypothetical protein